MKPESKITAYQLTFEDILFSNRNKAYGAYVLRQSYKKNMTFSCAVSILIFTLGISLPLLLNNKVPENISESPIGVVTFDAFPVLPVSIPKPIHQVTAMKPGVNTVKLTKPAVVPDHQLTKGNDMPSINDLINAAPAAITQKGQLGIDQTLIFSSAIEPVKVPRTESIAEKEHLWVEEMPQYKGGEKSLQSIITANMVYPEIARRAGIQGKVLLSFVIEKDGTISNIKVIKGIGGGCDEEAARVTLMLNKWNPGIQNGSPVRVRMIMPFFFKLN